MASTGYIQVSAFTSKARFPLEDVAITVTATDGTAIAMRLTDRSGRIPLIEIPVPDISESLTPDPSQRPFTIVDIYARRKGYVQIDNIDVQVFANTTTDQDLELIPLSELPESWGDKETFFTPAQDL